MTLTVSPNGVITKSEDSPEMDTNNHEEADNSKEITREELINPKVNLRNGQFYLDDLNRVNNGLPANYNPVFKDRYIARSLKGHGEWGIAYSVYDKLTNENFVAKIYYPSELAKKQLAERGLKIEDIIKKEARPLRNAKRLVTSFIEEDNNGQLFLMTKEFEGTLQDKLEYNNGDKKFLNHTICQ